MAAVAERAINGEFTCLRSKDLYSLAKHDRPMRAGGSLASVDHFGDVIGIALRRMHREKALQQFDPQTMVMRAAAFLVSQGPVTPQERWEEVGGFSPSTLAAAIAALICAAGVYSVIPRGGNPCFSSLVISPKVRVCPSGRNSGS